MYAFRVLILTLTRLSLAHPQRHSNFHLELSRNELHHRVIPSGRLHRSNSIEDFRFVLNTSVASVGVESCSSSLRPEVSSLLPLNSSINLSVPLIKPNASFSTAIRSDSSLTIPNLVTSSASTVLNTNLPRAVAFHSNVFSSANSLAQPPVTSSTSTASATLSSGPTSGKKGLAYSAASLIETFANTGMSWAYNWEASPNGALMDGVEFIPMLWGLDFTGPWSADAQSAISSGSTAALSFNEPDLPTQANIDPVTAAQNHIKYMNPINVEIGSPAITNGAGTSPLMGIDWLDAFFTACAGNCKVDFVAFHWYADASDTAYFQQHVMDVIGIATANGVSKVWLTEFGTTGGDTTTFLKTVMPFLESTPQVEKYAFFMCAAPQMLTGTSLNSVGQTYASE